MYVQENVQLMAAGDRTIISVCGVEITDMVNDVLPTVLLLLACMPTIQHKNVFRVTANVSSQRRLAQDR